jgi:hypothetical protein
LVFPLPLEPAGGSIEVAHLRLEVEDDRSCNLFIGYRLLSSAIFKCSFGTPPVDQCRRQSRPVAKHGVERRTEKGLEAHSARDARKKAMHPPAKLRERFSIRYRLLAVSGG